MYARIRAHLLAQIRNAPVWNEPFTHTYLEGLFPADVYELLLTNLPPPNRYWTGPCDRNAASPVRTFYHLNTEGVRRLPVAGRQIWRAVAAALTDPELKRCLYARLAPDLMCRFGGDEADVPGLPGYPRPTLYREIEGYELPPHPDTLKKAVTMHLYLPADLSQVHLGTALYQCDHGSCFTSVKQFEFRPNSGYAFVVNDSPFRQSWHGRERLPAGCGVRNTLLNVFYVEPRPGYSGYLNQDAGCGG